MNASCDHMSFARAYAGNERHVRAAWLLCNDTMHILAAIARTMSCEQTSNEHEQTHVCKRDTHALPHAPNEIDIPQLAHP